MTPPLSITLSASRLDVASCPRRYYYRYRVGRQLARPAAALTAGGAIHAGLLALDRGAGIPIQEAAIDAIVAASPPPPDDYRTAAYLKTALAAYRAEFPTPRWTTIEAMETWFDVELGTVEVLTDFDTVTRYADRNNPVVVHQTKALKLPVAAQVRWSGRVDRVELGLDGRRYVVEYKTSSFDRQADWVAMHNSDQLPGYAWWYTKTTGLPVHGGKLRRLVMRKPSLKGKGVTYEFPGDPPIMFTTAQVEEWRTNTLRLGAELLARSAADETDWPMQRGLCVGRFGPCEYLCSAKGEAFGPCSLPAENRAAVLASDLYEDVTPHGEGPTDV